MAITALKWLLAFAGIYVALLALLYVGQRRLMYFPETERTAPAAAGLADAGEVALDSTDGARVIIWHVPPRGERPVWLYFHGNGGALRYRAERFRELTAAGDGLVALSYRGYGGSSGLPSEAGLIADAEAAYAYAAARYPGRRIVLWGESLGSGVAVALAAGTREVRALVLEAPFLSAVDIAAGVYWFFPVRGLMKDQFRSDLRIGQVRAPILILHGSRDDVVPIASGERLYALVRGPKRFIRIEGGNHDDLGRFDAVAQARAFIETSPD